MKKNSIIFLVVLIASFVVNVTFVFAESINSLPGALQVTKQVDWSGSPPNPSQTFEICISGPTYPHGSCVDLSNGQSATWLELSPGEYVVKETDPGDEWIVSGTGSALVFSGKTTSRTVLNTRQPPGNLQVIKQVDWSGSSPNPSQTFEICVTGPTYPTTPSCVNLGDGQSATWLELSPGEYVVTETDPGEQWAVSGTGTAQVVSNQTAPLTVVNTYLPYGLYLPIVVR